MRRLLVAMLIMLAAGAVATQAQNGIECVTYDDRTFCETTIGDHTTYTITSLSENESSIREVPESIYNKQRHTAAEWDIHGHDDSRADRNAESADPCLRDFEPHTFDRINCVVRAISAKYDADEAAAAAKWHAEAEAARVAREAHIQKSNAVRAAFDAKVAAAKKATAKEAATKGAAR